MRWVCGVVLLAAVSAGAATTNADAPGSFGEIVESAIRPLMDAGYPGYVSVQIYTPGETYEQTHFSPLKAVAPSDGLVYEIGSITKVVTGVLLAHFVATGKLQLDDPIQGHLPEGVTAPEYNGRAITLLDLATHTSGLPRLPEGFAKVEGYDPANPYATISPDDVFAFLSRTTLGRAPGEKYEYSNFGFAVLGSILGLKAGKPYEGLVEEHLCEPLSLKTFWGTAGARQGFSLANGFTAEHQPAGNWDLFGFMGAGGLRADAGDVMAFMQAAMNSGGDSIIERAFRGSMQPYFKVSAHLKIGLGWHITDAQDGGELLYWHNGGTGGFRSFAGMLPESQLAVVVLGNVATEEIDHVARKILGGIAGRKFD